MTNRQRVVVTGLGVVDANAWGMTEAATAYANPNPQPIEIDQTAGYHRQGGPRRALLVDSKPQQEWLHPLAARRMSAASRFAVCASKMAIRNASLEPDEVEGLTAIVIATAYGAANISERILRQTILEGPKTVSPALFTESVANAPAAQIALASGSRAANVTVTQGQAGPAIALDRSLVELRTGRAKRVLVGAVDEMTPLLHAILGRFRALAQPDDRGVEQARPFDRNRNGWTASEGATVAVLELGSTAQDRGAPVLAEVIAAGSAFDPHSPRSGWSLDPSVLAGSLRRFLRNVGCDSVGIDCIVSGACGHRGADRLEARLLNTIWEGEKLPPVLAPAATAGTHGGSLLASAILAAHGRSFGPTPGFAEQDPDLGITPHDGSEFSPPKMVLLSTCATGGAAGWALLGPADK